MKDRFQALLSDYLDGALDPLDARELLRLVREDPERRRTFVELVQQHRALEAEFRPDDAERFTGDVLRRLAPAPRRRRPAWIGVPAAAALLLAALLLSRSGTLGTLDGRRVAAPTRVVLDDGTSLALEAGARLRRDPDRRLNLLEGALTADVAPQSSGFVLRTPHAEARVLGTRFRLSAAPESTLLEVLEGRVRLTRLSDGRAVEVAEGERAAAAEGVELQARPISPKEEVDEHAHPEPARVKGWSWKLPPDVIRPHTGRRNPVYYAGEKIEIGLGGGAASYELRDYYGRVVAKGPGATVITLELKPGWYKLYVYGKEVRKEWGDVLGGTTLCVFRKSPNFPELPASGVSGGSHPAMDQVLRGVTGMGPQRHRADANNPDGSIKALELDLGLDKTYYLPFDPLRKRALLVAFPGGTKNLAGVRKIVERFKDVVEYWEPRNEPNFGASGAGFVEKELKPFYETVKSVSPTLKVAGPGTVSIGPQLLPWIEDFLKGGGGKYIDAFSFHAYNNVNGDLWLARTAMESLNALLAKHGLENMEKWQTEQGYFAAVYGSYQPRLQGRWTMLQMMVYEQFGLPKERNHLWYDKSHGFWDMPTWWENEDGSLNPAAALMRVWSEELYGTTFRKAYDFGEAGNRIYVGSLFAGPDKAVAAFMSGGETRGGIDLKVSGGSSVRVVSPFGQEEDLPVHGGKVALPVSELPVYVRLARGQTLDVAPMDWGPNLARGATAVASGGEKANATVGKIVNGELENWYWRQKPEAVAWSNDGAWPQWVELRLPGPSKVGRVVIHAGVPWQTTGSPRDYELRVEKDGAWTTLERVTEPARTFGVYSPATRTTVDSFYADRCVFVHAFEPVTTSKLRLLIHDATWGGGATRLVSEAGGQANGAPVAHLRELEVYAR